MDLEQRLVDELTSNPGQKAAQLANKLDAPRQEISHLLNRLGHQFEQDSAYRWWPIDNVPNQNTEDSSAGFSKTPLARLCRYYLACLGQDDVGEISTWARSQHDYDYVALNEVPTNGIKSSATRTRPCVSAFCHAKRPGVKGAISWLSDLYQSGYLKKGRTFL